MEKQKWNGAHQPKGGGVHRHRDTGGQQVGLFGGVRSGNCGKGCNQPHNGAKQSQQGGDIGEQRHVRRALLQLRDDLHHAFFHGDFDVVTAPDRTLAR